MSPADGATGPMTPIPFRVADREQETPDTWTLELEPANGHAIDPFEPGQFAMLYAFGTGEVPISVSGDLTRANGRLVQTIRAAGAATSSLCRCVAEPAGDRGGPGRPRAAERRPRGRAASRALRAGHPQLRPLHLLRHPLPEARGGTPLTLVIGVGNRWRSDDGAGLELARRLRSEAPAEARVVEREGEPVNLMDEWDGAGEAIVVDAVSSGAAPGTIHRIDASARPLPAELFRGSTHALGLAEAVELSRALGRLPRHLLLIGIEGRRFAAGSGLTPEVEAAVARVTQEMRER